MAKVTAIIPARGGSKGIPGKNLKPFLGVPLVAHAIRAARAAQSVDAVLVSSDNPEILALSGQEGAEQIRRPESISGDLASSESAVLHAVETHPDAADADILVMLQCTAPLTSGTEIDQIVDAVASGGADTAFSVVETHVFLWHLSPDGTGIGVNHDPSKPRQRRQDRMPEYRETGAIYAFERYGFVKAGERFFGRSVPVPLENAVEIDLDTDKDWRVLESYVRAGETAEKG